MNLDAAATQSRRNLKPNKTRTKNDCPARRLCACNDGTAIRKRAKGMNVRLVAPGDPETNWLGPGRKQQSIIRNTLSVRERDFARTRIEADNVRRKSQVDCVFRIE